MDRKTSSNGHGSLATNNLEEQASILHAGAGKEQLKAPYVIPSYAYKEDPFILLTVCTHKQSVDQASLSQTKAKRIPCFLLSKILRTSTLALK